MSGVADVLSGVDAPCFELSYFTSLPLIRVSSTVLIVTCAVPLVHAAGGQADDLRQQETAVGGPEVTHLQMEGCAPSPASETLRFDFLRVDRADGSAGLWSTPAGDLDHVSAGLTPCVACAESNWKAVVYFSMAMAAYLSSRNQQ